MSRPRVCNWLVASTDPDHWEIVRYFPRKADAMRFARQLAVQYNAPAIVANRRNLTTCRSPRGRGLFRKLIIVDYWRVGS